MPSHRADTSLDAPVALLTRASAHPPAQRRRDLRARAAADPFPARRPVRRAPAQRGPALDWLEAPAPLTRPLELPASVGALALDPFPVPRPTPPAPPAPGERDESPSAFGLPVEQPARQPEALPSRRSLRAAGAKPPATTKVPAATRAPAPTTASRPEPAARRASALGLPQVGIAGALGIATIAVPLSGAFAVAPAAKPSSATAPSTAAALQPLPPFPLVAPSPATALDDVRLLPDQTEGVAVPARLAAPRVVLADRASRSDQRAVLPGCDGHVPDVTGVENGLLPASMLCTLWDPKRQLRSDAAVAIAKLNLAYRAKFGHPMCFNDAYRSLTEQYRVKAERGGYAARPGTSEHGWGLAVDLCDGVDNGSGSPTYEWMRDNAPAYGWVNPKWALSGGAGPYEPWHWEYFAGEKKESSGD